MIADYKSITSTGQLFQFVRDRVRKGKKLLTGPEEVTYREVFNKIASLGAFLHDSGIRPQEQVLVSVENDADMAVISLALFMYGFVFVPVNPDAALYEVRRVMKTLSVKGVIADRKTLAEWERHGLCEGISMRLSVAPRNQNTLLAKLLGSASGNNGTDKEYPGLLKKYSGDNTLRSAPPLSNVAMILHTSGTTGESKAVQLTGRNLMTQALIMTEQVRVNEDSCIMNLLPFSHIDAFANGVLLAFICGAALCRPVKFSNQSIPDILDSIYRYKVTHFILVPTMLSLILKLGVDIKEAFNTREFRYVISTGANLPENLWKKFEDAASRQVINFYGLTEANNLFFSGPDKATRKIGTIGKPIACEAKIMDDNDEPAGTGICGELAVKGDTLMAGYYNNDAATAGAIRNGWFYTGDLAVCDEEGFYSIIGRKKDLIISGGLNIFPDEINNALLSYPGIIEAATFGLPDEIWGDKAVSCVVSRDSAPLSEMEIRMFLRDRLSEYKIPKSIHFVAELPKGLSGKVRKDNLMRMISAESVNIANHGTDIQEKVLGLAEEHFSVPLTELNLQSGPNQCRGWDSMAHLNFVVGLEKQFNITFQPSDIVKMDSLAKGIEIVRNKLENR